MSTVSWLQYSAFGVAVLALGLALHICYVTRQDLRLCRRACVQGLVLLHARGAFTQSLVRALAFALVAALLRTTPRTQEVGWYRLGLASLCAVAALHWHVLRWREEHNEQADRIVSFFSQIVDKL